MACLSSPCSSSHEGVLSECKVRLVANEVLLDVATGGQSTSSRKKAKRSGEGVGSGSGSQTVTATDGGGEGGGQVLMRGEDSSVGGGGRGGEGALHLQRYVRTRRLDAQHAWGSGSQLNSAGRVVRVRVCVCYG